MASIFSNLDLKIPNIVKFDAVSCIHIFEIRIFDNNFIQLWITMNNSLFVPYFLDYADYIDSFTLVINFFKKQT